MLRVFTNLISVLFLPALVCGCGQKKPTELEGSGSTFVYPLMVQWSVAYERSDTGCKISYQSAGSGFGIRSLIEKKGDFICSDAPLSDDQLAKAGAAGGPVLHIPLVMGAVVPAYNLPELSEPLHFSGPVLADIYLGKITKWNDDALKELNPKIKDELPKKDIVVVHRSDGSGTTYVWVDYLSKVSPTWKDKVGVGTEVPWPTGAAAVGNNGVSRKVKETLGGIGYVELSYAFRQDLQVGLVQNREKEFVKASPASVKKSADQVLVNLPEDLRYSLTDAPGKGSYPICGTTWAIVYANQTGDKGRQLVDFLLWTLDQGQEDADMLLYVRLPESLQKRAVDQVKKIKVEK